MTGDPFVSHPSWISADPELATHLRRDKGRVVLREVNVKDDNGHKAVFSEQGAAASRVAAGTFVNSISRLHGMCKRSQRRGISLYACRHVGSSQIAEITTERMPTRMYKASTESKTNGRSGGFFFRMSTFMVTFLAGQFGKENGKMYMRSRMEAACEHWNVIKPSKTTTALVYVCQRLKKKKRLGRKRLWDQCGIFHEHTSTWNLQPLSESSVSRLHSKRCRS